MTVQRSAPPPLQAFPSVRAWQASCFNRGILPVIGVTGERGKSTVVRMLDAILRAAHLRTATWTNLGVELRGRRQRGEISGWTTALSRLQEGTLDVAVQELDWSTINTVGPPPGMYPLFAITNLCGHPEPGAGFAGPAAAIRGSVTAAQAVHATGHLVAGGDDHGLAEALHAARARVVVAALSSGAPLLRAHLDDGGRGVWVEASCIQWGTTSNRSCVAPITSLPVTRDGEASFEIANVLTAVAIAGLIGIDAGAIERALGTFRTTPDVLPGSFNAYELGGYTVLIDRLAGPRHVRALLRAMNPGDDRRLIAVLGSLDDLDVADAREIGRLLGRHHGIVILHSVEEHGAIDAFRRGVAANEYPPLVVRLPTERRAINRALGSADPDDIVMLLTGSDPGPATRAVHRRMSPPAATTVS